ncbi:MAG TPA: bifunctional shikimate kinase/3-dehydroquinate synthase [Candidatus Limnocylindria bacterium]|nr:bifunctional shikimate kinase/3-dehydroquinate synthase [Candidatus Limnocylindria bacterium]
MSEAVEIVPLPAPPLAGGRANLVLAGFMGTGKTAVGREVAAELGLPFLDLDDAVARQAGRSVAEIFATEGEAGFRARERLALRDAACLSGTVIATGGGAPLQRASFAPLAASALVVLLTADPDEIARRLGEAQDRPLLRGDVRARIGELLDARRTEYGRLGTPVVTTGRAVGDVAREVAQRYREAQTAGPVSLTVPTGGTTTRVIVGHGVLAHSAGALREALPGTVRAAIVTDSAVAETHAAAVADALREAGIEPVGPITLPAGEGAKRADVLAWLWDRLRDEDLDPSAAIVAVGGGSALDVAGFAAATYARGLPLVNVPTTVLAMADASVGGKVAIDHAGAKNLVGAFHPARLVIADPAACATLPTEVLRQGLAEVVKSLVLAAPAALALAADAPLDWSVEQSLRVKAAYVAADPLDRGVRRALNLGHTYAHAIESASDYLVPHGDAVAIGLVAAARLGAFLGTCDPSLAVHVADVLQRLGLPTVAPPLDEDRLLAALSADKKRAAGKARFVVPAEGGAALVTGVDPREALAMLRS